MQDAWRAYLELVLGLSEATRRRAEQAARDLIGKGGATAAQVQAFTEELVSTSRANRDALAKLVRYEVDRALGAVGLATTDEVAQLEARLRRVEQRLDEVAAQAAAAQTAARKAPAKAAKKAPAKKAAATKAAANKTTRSPAPATSEEDS